MRLLECLIHNVMCMFKFSFHKQNLCIYVGSFYPRKIRFFFDCYYTCNRLYISYICRFPLNLRYNFNV